MDGTAAPADGIDGVFEELPALMASHSRIRAIIEDDEGAILISSLEAETERSGYGSAFMRDLVHLADLHQVSLEVDPAASDKEGLASFYSRFGFYWANEDRLYRDPGDLRLISILDPAL